MRNGCALSRVVIDPHPGAFRAHDPVDLVHRRRGLTGVEVEGRDTPMNEVSLEMRDIATQYDGARSRQAHHKRAVARRMARGRDDADRPVTEHVMIAFDDLGRIAAKGFMKLSGIAMVCKIGTEHGVAFLALRDPFRLRE